MRRTPCLVYLRSWILALRSLCGLLALVTLSTVACAADNPTGPGLSLNIHGIQGPEDYGIAVQLIIFTALLSLAPAIFMLMTSFTRIVIVLGFVRNALGLQQAPSNQIVIGLAFFLTLFLMGNVWDNVYNQAITPYMEKKISSLQALEVASGHLKTFMLKQTQSKDVEFFLGLAGGGGPAAEGLPLKVVVPAFILSELKTAFQMGFMIFIPFLVIDFLVASTLMAMGMMMMPPAILSMPFKLLLFVLVDGWYLVVRSIVQSFLT